MAHGDTGTIDPVLVQQAEGRLAIDVQVVVRFTNDDERAEGATVTAVAVSPDGTATEPVTLTAASAPGAYVGVVDVPAGGAWTVRIVAATPDATLEVPAVEVAQPASTTTTTGSTTTTATTGEPRAVESDDDGGGIGAAPLAILGVLVAIGAAVGFRLSRRR